MHVCDVSRSPRDSIIHSLLLPNPKRERADFCHSMSLYDPNFRIHRGQLEIYDFTATLKMGGHIAWMSHSPLWQAYLAFNNQ